MDVRDLDEDSIFSDGEGDNPETTVQYQQTTSVLFRWSQSRRANSISTSSLPITYQVDTSGSAEPPESFPSPTVQERDEVLTELFTDANGVRMDLGEIPDERYSVSVQSTQRFSMLRRTTTTETTVSRWTVSHIEGMTMKLNKLVELIRLHRTLQRIEIVSSECYKQRNHGILHRFLVLALRRKDKSPVWLRLDRRMDPDISRVGFLLASSQSPANDTAIFSADKSDLIQKAQYESRQQFINLTTLDDLRHLLQVICEELVVYQLWPANCWFFVSLLQQHLQGDRSGYFVDGSIKWGETAQVVRYRVDERLRLIYHVPLPLTTENILLSLQGRPELNNDVQALVRNALVCADPDSTLYIGILTLSHSQTPPKKQSQWIQRDDLQIVTASFSSATKSAELLHKIAFHLDLSPFHPEALYIQQQTVKIARKIYKRDVLNHGHRVPDAQGPRALFQRIQSDPSLHRANFARYLYNLGVYLHDAQRYSDACATHQEAVMLARELFEIDPGSYRATLAKYLRELGVSLHDAQRYSDACATKQEAVMLARELFKANPGSHCATLAGYLHSLGMSLHEGQRYSDAFAAYQEAITLARKLFEVNPGAQRAILASYLRELGVCLHQAQRYSDACTTHQEAITLARELFEANPGAQRAILASYLRELGIYLHLAQRYSEACAAHQEAVILARDLFEADPGSHRATLAFYLNQLGVSLHQAQRYSDACTTHQEAVMHARELFEADPGSHCATLASYLRHLGGSLHQAQRYSDACATKKEAVMLARELFEADSGSHCATLALYLNQFGVSLHLAQRYSDGCAADQEAVILTRGLFEADPGSHRATLARYLNQLAVSLHLAQRHSDACDTVQEAVQYQRQLSNDDPALHCKDLLQYLNFYVRVLEAQGLWAEIPGIKAEISQVESS